MTALARSKKHINFIRGRSALAFVVLVFVSTTLLFSLSSCVKGQRFPLLNPLTDKDQKIVSPPYEVSANPYDQDTSGYLPESFPEQEFPFVALTWRWIPPDWLFSEEGTETSQVPAEINLPMSRKYNVEFLVERKTENRENEFEHIGFVMPHPTELAENVESLYRFYDTRRTPGISYVYRARARVSQSVPGAEKPPETRWIVSVYSQTTYASIPPIPREERFGPHISWFEIDYPLRGVYEHGISFTTDKRVVLDHMATGGPQHFRASESRQGLQTSQWQLYSRTPAFELSPQDGIKTVYFQVKNDWGESNIVEDSICDVTQGQTHRLCIQPTLIPDRFKINGGADETNEARVTLNHSLGYGRPTEYRAALTRDFSGASWQPYKDTETPNFDLPKRCVEHEIFFQLRNYARESAIVSDSITYRFNIVDDWSLIETYRTARNSGFDFSASPLVWPWNTNCMIRILPNAFLLIAHEQTDLFLPTAVCEFTLFGGKELANGWTAKGVDFIGDGSAELPNEGDRSLEIKVPRVWSRGAEAQGVAIIKNIRLSGPCTGNFIDAFRNE